MDLLSSPLPSRERFLERKIEILDQRLTLVEKFVENRFRNALQNFVVSDDDDDEFGRKAVDDNGDITLEQDQHTEVSKKDDERIVTINQLQTPTMHSLTKPKKKSKTSRMKHNSASAQQGVPLKKRSRRYQEEVVLDDYTKRPRYNTRKNREGKEKGSSSSSETANNCGSKSAASKLFKRADDFKGDLKPTTEKLEEQKETDTDCCLLEDEDDPHQNIGNEDDSSGVPSAILKEGDGGFQDDVDVDGRNAYLEFIFPLPDKPLDEFEAETSPKTVNKKSTSRKVKKKSLEVEGENKTPKEALRKSRRTRKEGRSSSKADVDSVEGRKSNEVKSPKKRIYIPAISSTVPPESFEADPSRQKCSICHMHIKIEHYKTHVDSHIKERHLKCSQCEKTYFNQSMLRKHMRVHQPEKYGKNCRVCNKLFLQSDKQLAHERACVKKKLSKKEVVDPGIIEDLKNRSPGWTIKIPDDDNDPLERKECPLCNKSFKASFYERHLKLHTISKDWICKLCNKAYYHKHDMVRHFAMEHAPLKCPTCSETFTDKTMLKGHEIVCSSVFKPKVSEPPPCGMGIVNESIRELAEVAEQGSSHEIFDSSTLAELAAGDDMEVEVSHHADPPFSLVLVEETIMNTT